MCGDVDVYMGLFGCGDTYVDCVVGIYSLRARSQNTHNQLYVRATKSAEIGSLHMDRDSDVRAQLKHTCTYKGFKPHTRTHSQTRAHTPTQT